MDMQVYQNKKQGFTLIEMVTVIFIVSVILLVLSFNPLGIYHKYRERLALNNLISDINFIQTQSLKDSYTRIIFFPNNRMYMLIYGDKSIKKYLTEEGKISIDFGETSFNYKKGHLVSKANTIYIDFTQSKYKIIVHLDTGYITTYER